MNLSNCKNIFLIFLVFFISSCSSRDLRTESSKFIDQHTSGAVSAETKLTDDLLNDDANLPERFQSPTFLLSEAGLLEKNDDFVVPVGADISSNRGPISLRDILKRLAVLKRMNVSWADDVDQMALVDVDIRAEDDFFPFQFGFGKGLKGQRRHLPEGLVLGRNGFHPLPNEIGGNRVETLCGVPVCDHRQRNLVGIQQPGCRNGFPMS